MTIKLIALAFASSIVFLDHGQRPVAQLIYDQEQLVCRQEGSVEDALRVVMAADAECEDRYSRLRWGDAQVDAWKREEREFDRKQWRR